MRRRPADRRRLAVALGAILAVALVSACAPEGDPAPSPSPTATVSPTPTRTPTATPSPTPSPTLTPAKQPATCGEWNADDASPSLDVPDISDTSAVGRTWAGMQVGQSLLTTATKQYVAYYNPDRNLVVAQRSMNDRGLPSSGWKRTTLDTQLGWDSHNYVTMAVDRDGTLHVAGNMHAVPLNYFRTDPGGDVSTLTRVDAMVDASLEQRVTYPVFLRMGDGVLLFYYRDGDSTDGSTYINRYDEETSTWSAMSSGPLLDGTDGDTERNGYLTQPVVGPDGFFHVLWVWRDTPDVATNSVLSYAKTRDFQTWYTADGTELQLPMGYREGDVVDPIPEDSGLINGIQAVGFDDDGTTVVTYAKYDDDRNMQLWAATPRGDGWRIQQLTRWTNDMTISGQGTIDIPIGVTGMTVRDDGLLEVDYTCEGSAGELLFVKRGDRYVFLSQDRRLPKYPRSLTSLQGSYPGLATRLSTDLALTQRRDPKHTYVLRWESLGTNQDQERDEWPERGSRLTVVRLD